uniref:UDP-N-acetylglucosamine transferase subunit ALG14 n=1 Tax=Syphacia muris TaxID=451379 RepID=A0A0N5AD54_9BILA
MVLIAFVLLLFLSILVALCRSYRRRHSTSVAKKCETVSLCAVLGSGGHTTEMLSLLEELSPKYTPRLYIVSKSDILSLKKVTVREMEQRKDGTFNFVYISRSREVLQSYITSIFTTLKAFLECLWIARTRTFDLLICNGPGTCIPVCFAVALFDLVRLRNTKIVYFESICRVERLSLSGKLLYFLGITDLFVVYWPELLEKYPKAKLITNLTTV